MYLRSYTLLIYTLSFAFLSKLSTSTDLDLYVDNQITSSPDVLKEKLFSQLSDCLEFILNEKSPTTNYNVFIASGSQPYSFGKRIWNFNELNVAGLTISQWKEANDGQNLPMLDFKDSSLRVNNILFTISSLNIAGYNGNIELTNSIATIKNINFLPQFGEKDQLFIFRNCKSVLMSEINLTVGSSSNFIYYVAKSFSNQPAPVITIEKMNIILKGNLDKNDEDFSASSLIHLRKDIDEKSEYVANLIFREVTVQSSNPELPFDIKPILTINNFHSVTFEDFKIQNQQFSYSHNTIGVFEDVHTLFMNRIQITRNKIKVSTSSPFFVMNKVQNLTNINTTFSSNNFEIAPDKTFKFMDVYVKVQIIANQFQDFSLIENIFNGNTKFLAMSAYRTNEDTKTPKLNPKIYGLNITGNNNSPSSNTFSFLVIQTVFLESFKLANVDFAKNQLSGRIFSFQGEYDFSAASTRIKSPPGYPLSMTNIIIRDNLEAIDTSFLYSAPIPDDLDGTECNCILDPYGLQIKNMTVKNNKFSRGNNIYWVYEASFFQAKATEIRIFDSSFENNSFDLYTFFKLDEKPSNFFIVNSNFIHNKFNSSQFVTTNFRKMNQPCRKSYSPGYKTTILYRVGYVYSCSFSNIYLNSSTFFTLNNGYFLFQNNKLDEVIITRDSKFASTTFKNTRLPPTSSGFVREDNLISLVIYSYELADKWKETKAQVVEYQPDFTYFYSLSGNSFKNIELNSSVVFYLKDYGFPTSFVGMENNQINSIDAMDSELASSFFKCEAFDMMVIQNNLFNGILGKINVLDFPNNGETQFLKFSNNVLTQLQVTRVLVYKGHNLTKVEITKNLFENFSLSGECLSIISEISKGEVLFSENNFKKISVTHSEQVQGDQFAFINIQSYWTFSSIVMIFKDNIFEDINIGSRYSESFGYELHLLTIASYQNIDFINNRFRDNSIYSYGSLIQFAKSVNLTINNTLFEEIYLLSKTGMLTVFGKNLLIYNTKFTYVETSNAGGVIYLKPEEGNYIAKVLDCVFEDIVTSSQGLIFTVNPLNTNRFTLDFQFSNCKITRVIQQTLFYILGGTCENCSISDTSISIKQLPNAYFDNLFKILETAGNFLVRNISFPGSVIPWAPYFDYIDAPIQLTLQDIIFDGRGNHLYLAKLSTGGLIIKDSIFKDIRLRNSTIISVIKGISIPGEAPKVHFENTVFSNIIFKEDEEDNDLVNYQHNALLELFSYKLDPAARFQPSILISGVPVNITAINSNFENIFNANIILCAPPKEPASFNTKETNIHIENSNFNNLSAITGTALAILPEVAAPTVVISSTKFTNCSAYVGGALSLYHTTLYVDDSIFRNVSAKLIGAMVFKGGHIQFSHSLLNIINENTFAEFDNLVGTEASTFELMYVSDFENGIKTSISEDTYVMKNVSSWEFKQGYFELLYLDVGGHKACDLSQGEKVEIQIPYKEVKEQYNTFPVTPIREDGNRFMSRIPLKNITLTGRANDIILMKLIYKSSQITKTQKIKITLRECLPGEYDNGLFCEPCQSTTYSLHPSNTCTECPRNAFCKDHSKICPISGFWNANDSSPTVVQCPDGTNGSCHSEKGSESCRNCREGHTGPFCSACDFKNGYVESGYFECKKCTDPQESLIRTLLLGFAYFIYQIFSIYVVYKGTYQTSTDEIESIAKRYTERSYYLKSLVTYAQLMSTICITSPQIFRLLGLSSQIGNPSFLIIYGTQCALTALGIDYNQFIYFQTYLVIAIPFIQLPFIVAVFYLLSKCFKSISMKRIIPCSIIYIIIVYQPGIAANLALFLSCATIKGLGYNYIASHPHWSCDDPQYDFVSKLIVGPNLVFWCIVVTFIIFRVLRSAKLKSVTERTESSFAMLLIDLKEENRYWGFVLMLLKLSTAMLMYGLETQPEIQIFSFLLLLWIYQSLTRIIHPFKEDKQNTFEIFTTNLLIFNMIIIKCLVNPVEKSIINEIFIVIGTIVNSSFVFFVVSKIVLRTLFKKAIVSEREFWERDSLKGSTLNESLISSQGD